MASDRYMFRIIIEWFLLFVRHRYANSVRWKNEREKKNTGEQTSTENTEKIQFQSHMCWNVTDNSIQNVATPSIGDPLMLFSSNRN